MKLKQFHKYTLVIFEIKDVSLKITQQKILKKETSEILFENILMEDLYELEYHEKGLLPYMYVSLYLFGHITYYSLLNNRLGWIFPSIFGALALSYLYRFFIKQTKIYIPSIDQGMISLFKKKPSKRIVKQFITLLEERVNLTPKKMTEKTNLKEFISQYFPKNK